MKTEALRIAAKLSSEKFPGVESPLVLAITEAVLGSLVGDMYWDAEDPERAEDSIHEIMVERVECGLRDGEEFSVQQAYRLPDLRCRLKIIPETDDSDEEHEYEVVGEEPRPEEPPHAMALIHQERWRQISVEGWTPQHDDEHGDGQLASAAACYALGEPDVGEDFHRVTLWPWDAWWWKPTDRVRDLVKAGALIAAEIERLQRAAKREG